MKPAISICVPTYNGSEFIKECLDSILNQTFSDFEVIIVDDKSSDQTIEIIRVYASKDSRITIIENPQNLGLVGNWNRCIELSKGEWIKFIFQDDTIAPNCLERMLEESTPECDLVFCRRNFIFESNVSDEKRKEYERFVDSDKALPNTTQITAYEYCQTMVSQPWVNIIGEPTSSMVRRRAFDRFGGFNPNLIQICDLELWDRIATNMGITFLRENLAAFRVHNESTTAKNHTSLTYRVSLDFMIMAHDFAFHPAYQNLRKFCVEQTKLDLSELMRREAYYAWIRGQSIAAMKPQESKKIDLAWEVITEKYPRIAEAKNLNLFKQIQYKLLLQVSSLKREVSLRINALVHRINSTINN